MLGHFISVLFLAAISPISYMLILSQYELQQNNLLMGLIGIDCIFYCYYYLLILLVITFLYCTKVTQTDRELVTAELLKIIKFFLYVPVAKFLVMQLAIYDMYSCYLAWLITIWIYLRKR